MIKAVVGWGLRQPDQHVQRSCGRKEHAERKAKLAGAQRGKRVRGEARKRLRSGPIKSTEKLLSVLSWRWFDQICIFKGSL